MRKRKPNKAKPRLLYHCSVFDHGDVLTVKRQTPLFPDAKEPPVPRLCVAPTIPQGLSARWFPDGKDAHVYVTEKKMRGITPKDVWDELVTSERWLLPGTRLVKHSVIPSAVIDDIYDGIKELHTVANKPCNLKIRVATLWRCCVALPEHAKRLKWVDECCKSFDIDPITFRGCRS